MNLLHKRSERVEQVAVILNDLIKINNERIACYQHVINQATRLDNDVKDVFREIITEAEQFKQELIERIKEFNGNPTSDITISGIVHRAWLDLKVSFRGNSRNAVTSYCQYNERVAQQAYEAALDFSGKIPADIRKLIEKQHKILNDTYSLVRKVKESLHYQYPGLVYFN